MKGIILAAGRGSRLKALTDEKPKCLQNIAGRTLLEWNLTALTASGIKENFVVTGYRSEMLEPYPVNKIFNPQWDKGNMVKSFLCAKKHFNDTVIVTYSDILYSAEVIQKLINFPPFDIVVVYDTEWRKLWEARFSDPLSDAETFKVNTEGRILEIGQKPKSFNDIQGQYMGLMRFHPRALEKIVAYLEKQTPEVLAKLDMTALLQGIILEGIPVYGMPIHGGWCEVDTPSDLALAQKLFLQSY